MGLISSLKSNLQKKDKRTCLPTLERPEKCEAKSATVTDELVNTESIQVDEVWLVVNITTESTSTNTIQVTLVKSVCDTSMKKNKYFCPTINVDNLWSLVGEEVRKEFASKSEAPVIDCTAHNIYKVLAKGKMPDQP